jgi:L-fucose mutarotase
MLKNINPILTGELLHALSDMGHGDEIVVADGNFAADSHGPAIWVPSNDTVAVVRTILDWFPIDKESNPFAYICAERPTNGDPAGSPSQAALQFGKLIDESDTPLYKATPLTSEKFRRRARGAYAIVATIDPRHFACFILTKGVLLFPSARPQVYTTRYDEE